MTHDSGKAMYSFVTALESSSYAVGLFPWTSMLDLCIAQTPVEYPYNGPYLRISPKPGSVVELRYLDSWIKAKQWNRTVPAAETFHAFERFIDHLHWFAKPLRE